MNLIFPDTIIKSHKTKISSSKNLLENFQIMRNILQNKISINYHGIEMNIFSSELSFLNEILDLIPSEWVLNKIKNSINIYWHNPNTTIESWCEVQDPNFYIGCINNTEVAIQRDFLGIDHNDGNIDILSPYEMNDFFYNPMRWLIPRKLHNFHNFVLHSSSVIGSDNKARVFLGHSGAGKTTITTLSNGRKILHDDMNILFKENNNYYISSSLLGSSLNIKQTSFQKFPIHAFYWITKAEQNNLKLLNSASASIKLITSFPNMFWEHSISSHAAMSILNEVREITKKLNVYELEFKKDTTFWDLIDKGPFYD